MEEGKTVGTISSELMVKEPESTDPIELERSMQEKYMDNLVQCVEDARKIHFGNFYVVVLTKRERLMPNVFRNYFLPRLTCPTPDYDQAVFYFDVSAESITYLWSIPSQDTCHYLKDNALYVAPEEKQLLQFVLDFADGTLFKKAKILNGEKELATPLLEGV
jgi:hypothetical protein